MTLNVILNDKINGIGFDVTDQRFSSSGSGLWSLNRTEWTEFVWTKNGPEMDLDMSLTIGQLLTTQPICSLKRMQAEV